MRITAEPFEQTAEALRRVIPGVIDATLQRLRRELPELRNRSRFYLTDALPELLEQLADVMAQGLPGVTLLAQKAQEHAQHREQQEFALDEMLLEYQLVREALPVALAQDLGRDLSTAEAFRIHGAIDLSMREAAAIFAEHQKRRVQAEAAAMAKYLAFLSHDLRGNLNGAMLMIEVLRRDLAAEPRFAESVADLDAMRQAMLDLVSTMDRFLQAERLRQGRVEVSLQTVELGGFLQEQRRAIARQMRGIEDMIDLKIDGQDLCVRTDREMLALVVHNTLGNCVKYADAGRVTLRARRLVGSSSDNAPETQWFRIEVSDAGPGMDEEFQKRLFEPFVRGSDTGRPGTGLGLYIAKQAADLLGATLRVQSKPGDGTTFIIDVPNYSFAGADEFAVEQ